MMTHGGSKHSSQTRRIDCRHKVKPIVGGNGDSAPVQEFSERGLSIPIALRQRRNEAMQQSRVHLTAEFSNDVLETKPNEFDSSEQRGRYLSPFSFSNPA